MLQEACLHRAGAFRIIWKRALTLCPLIEHFLMPWNLLRVLSENIRYPLRPFFRSEDCHPSPASGEFRTFSLSAYLSVAAHVILATHAITACTLGPMVTPLPYRSLAFLRVLRRSSRVFSSGEVRCVEVLFSPFVTMHR